MSEVSTVDFRDGVLNGIEGSGFLWGCGRWQIDGSVVNSLTMSMECDVTITDSCRRRSTWRRAR